MKILRIFGIVAAVHLFGFVLIMANPGCSTKSRAKEPVMASQAPVQEQESPLLVAPISQDSSLQFNSPSSAGENRFSPTRPGQAPVHAEAPDQGVVEATTVTVQSGDSLWKIAKRHKIPVDALAAANNVKTSAVLRIGQKLIVPSQAMPAMVMNTENGVAPVHAQAQPAKVVESEQTDAKGSQLTYVVKKGDTLGAIARRFGVRSQDIAIANNIANPAMIPVGKVLVISKRKAGNSKPTASTVTARPAQTSQAAPQPQNQVSEPAQEASPQVPVLESTPVLSPTQPAEEAIPVLQIEDEAN